MLFKEDHIIKIEIEKLKLGAIEQKLKEVKPLADALGLEFVLMKEDIAKMEKELEEPEE